MVSIYLFLSVTPEANPPLAVVNSAAINMLGMAFLAH